MPKKQHSNSYIWVVLIVVLLLAAGFYVKQNGLTVDPVKTVVVKVQPSPTSTIRPVLPTVIPTVTPTVFVEKPQVNAAGNCDGWLCISNQLIDDLGYYGKGTVSTKGSCDSTKEELVKKYRDDLNFEYDRAVNVSSDPNKTAQTIVRASMVKDACLGAKLIQLDDRRLVPVPTPAAVNFDTATSSSANGSPTVVSKAQSTVQENQKDESWCKSMWVLGWCYGETFTSRVVFLDWNAMTAKVEMVDGKVIGPFDLSDVKSNPPGFSWIGWKNFYEPVVNIKSGVMVVGIKPSLCIGKGKCQRTVGVTPVTIVYSGAEPWSTKKSDGFYLCWAGGPIAVSTISDQITWQSSDPSGCKKSGELYNIGAGIDPTMLKVSQNGKSFPFTKLQVK